MMWTQRAVHGDLIVFWRGIPIYKRWPNGMSVVMDPYGPAWSTRR